MNLLELLARKLKHWPHNVEAFVQGSNGNVYPAGGIGPVVGCWQLADDWELAEVKRAQWDAAVAELAQFPWFPGDLPPVGTTCEVNGTVAQELRRQDFSWVKCDIVAHTSFGGAPIAVGRCLEDATFGWGIAAKFRPLLTEAQKAAKQREEDIQSMIAIATATGSPLADADDPEFRVLIEALHDANYRKQVTP